MGAGERGAEPAPGSPAFPPRRCCRLFSKPLFFLSTFFSSFSLCLCQPRRRWRSFAVGKEGVRQMTVLPSRRGTLQSVGATTLISCKWEMFRYPFLVFHWHWKAEPPKREVLIPGLPVPAAPLFAHPQPLALPKAGCSPPTRGFCSTASGFWGKSCAQRSPRQGLRDRGLPSLLVCQHWHMHSQAENNLLSVAGVEGAAVAQMPCQPCAHELQSGEECSEGAAFLCVSFLVSLSEPKAVTSTGASPVQL